MLRSLYDGLFRRTSTFIVTVVAASVVFEQFFDVFTDSLYTKYNDAVSSDFVTCFRDFMKLF